MTPGAGGRPTLVDPAVLDAFDQLRERLATRRSWIQGAWARVRKSDVRTVWSTDERATCWCLAGAIDAVRGSTEVIDQLSATIAAAIPTPNEYDNPITGWNDEPTRTHRDVLDLIDKAKAHYLAEATP